MPKLTEKMNPDNFEDIEVVANAFSIPLDKANQLMKARIEYQKPNHGKWEGNT